MTSAQRRHQRRRKRIRRITYRRRKAQRTALTLAWRFVSAPWTDKPDYDLSLARLIATAIMFEVVHTIERTADHQITWMHVVCFFMASAIAFGKATFTFLLTRTQIGIAGVATMAAATNKTTIDATSRVIQERRIVPPAGGGFEPTD